MYMYSVDECPIPVRMQRKSTNVAVTMMYHFPFLPFSPAPLKNFLLTCLIIDLKLS